MTPAIPPSHPLRRWFRGLVENALYADVGMCEPGIADYMTDLLTNFLHVDQIYLFRDAKGRRIQEIGEMLANAIKHQVVDELQRRHLVYRHVGDFALFWTGLYPESLRRIRSARSGDALRDYLDQGKQSYRVAAELCDDEARPPARLFAQMSESFEYCVYGLAMVRKGWEQEDPDGYVSIRNALGL